MFGWFVGASGLFTPCRHESSWVLGSPIFRHIQYIHLWIKFYSSCDYHLTGITPNLMNLNSIQQQAKKKKAVDTAAESSSTPMGCPFFKKSSPSGKIRPVRQASAHSCERQPRANLRGMVKMRAARMNLNVFNLQTKRNFQQSEIFFQLCFNCIRISWTDMNYITLRYLP